METKEIVLCPTCNGSGQTSYEECVDYHKRDYETIYEICKRCDGTGRLKKITIVTLSVFDPAFIAWAAQPIIAVVLTIGWQWPKIWRSATGTVTTDDIDNHHHSV